MIRESERSTDVAGVPLLPVTGGEKSEESSGGLGACGQAPRGQVALGQQAEVVALQSVSVSRAPDFYLPALRFLLSSPVGSISGVDYRPLTVARTPFSGERGCSGCLAGSSLLRGVCSDPIYGGGGILQLLTVARRRTACSRAEGRQGWLNQPRRARVRCASRPTAGPGWADISRHAAGKWVFKGS